MPNAQVGNYNPSQPPNAREREGERERGRERERESCDGQRALWRWLAHVERLFVQTDSNKFFEGL